MFVFANRGNQIWNLFIENIFGVLSSAPARGTVQSVDGFVIVGCDHGMCFRDSPARKGIFGSGTKIHLACIGGTDVIALAFVLPHVSEDVGPRCHCLRLESFELPVCPWTEFVGHNTKQIFFEREVVHHRKRIPRIAEYFDRPSICSIFDFNRRPRRLDSHFRFQGKHEQLSRIKLHEHAVIKVGPGKDAIRTGGVQRQHRREFSRARSVLLNGKRRR